MNSQSKFNIFLIGMMGSGKSSIGRQLAKLLDLVFVDIDKELEIITKLSINEMFKKFGEEKFREMEGAFFREKATQDHLVFATGGGIILSKQNRTIMRESGMVIFLDVPLNILTERLNGVSDRPLLKSSHDISTDLTSIWKTREKFYRNTAHFTLDATPSPHKCANTILEILGK